MNLIKEIRKRVKIKSAGLQINYVGDKKYTYQLFILEKANNQVRCILNENYDKIEQVVKTIPSLIPINVGIDGKEVLTRQIDNSDLDEPLQSVLPNASSKDFVVQTTESIWEKPLVSIIRRSSLITILDILNEKGLFPFSISLGVSPLAVLVKLFSSHDSIRIPNYTIKVHDSVFSDLIKEENKPTEYNLEGQVLSSEFLLPFSLAMNYYIKNNASGLTNPLAIKQKKDYIYKRKLKRTFIKYLVGLFIILLINSFIYLSIRVKYNGINNQILSNKQNVSRIKHLEQLISEKQLLIGINNNNEIELYSFYADRIAHSLISGIILRSMIIFPPSESIRSRGDKIPDYISDHILIEGFSSGSIKLNNWILALNQYNWIKDLRIINYQDELETGQATFKLELILRNNEPKNFK
ncbi:MAG: hypothetical protein ACQERS_11195 [Bacteroidota bacterium]